MRRPGGTAEEVGVQGTIALVPKVRLWERTLPVATPWRGGQDRRMRSRYRVHEPDRAHFVTSTIVAWLPVFTSPECCQIFVDAFAYGREHKGLHPWLGDHGQSLPRRRGRARFVGHNGRFEEVHCATIARADRTRWARLVAEVAAGRAGTAQNAQSGAGVRRRDSIHTRSMTIR